MNNAQITHRCQFDIEKMEEHFGSRYVCDTQHPEDSLMRVSIFYNDEPHPEGSNYMGAFSRGTSVYVCDGAFVLEQSIDGAVADDGEIIYSADRHDYVDSQDGSVSIDGGREYLRVGFAKTSPKIVPLHVVKDKLVVDEELLDMK